MTEQHKTDMYRLFTLAAYLFAVLNWHTLQTTGQYGGDQLLFSADIWMILLLAIVPAGIYGPLLIKQFSKGGGMPHPFDLVIYAAMLIIWATVTALVFLFFDGAAAYAIAAVPTVGLLAAMVKYSRSIEPIPRGSV